MISIQQALSILKQPTALALMLLSITTTLFMCLTAILTYDNSRLSSQVLSNEKRVQTNSNTKLSLSNEDKANFEEAKQLDYFIKEVLHEYPEFQESLGKQVTRRVTSVELNEWFVEVFDNSSTDYKPDPRKPRSVVEQRTFYLLRDGVATKLNQEPLPCYIEEFRHVSPRNSSPNTRLDHTMLILSGPCNRGSRFVTLYNYNTAKQVVFTDPNLLMNSINDNFKKRAIIDENGNTNGLLEVGHHGSEPVIAIRYGPLDGVGLPWGIGVFSVRTGQLKDLLIYNSF